MFAHLLVERTWLWCLHTAAVHSGVGVLSSLGGSSAHIGGVSPVDRGKGRATLSQWQLFLTLLNLTFITDILGGIFSKLWCPSFLHLVPILRYPSCSLWILPKNVNRNSLSWHAGLTPASVFKARIWPCDLQTQAPAFPQAKETDPRLSSLTHFQDKSSVPEIDGTLVDMLLASYPSASSKCYYPKRLALRDRHIALSVTQCPKAAPYPLSP